MPTRSPDAAAVTGHDKEVDQGGAQGIPRHRLLGDEGRRHADEKLEAAATLMKKIGAIKPDKEPVTYA